MEGMKDFASEDFLSVFDFSLSICGEKKKDNGEDAFLYSFNKQGGIIGALDGCGGAGSKKYAEFHGKTGAFMSSRVVAGATKDWFLDLTRKRETTYDTNRLKERINEYLSICKRVGGSSYSVKGTLTKEFPTTAAIIACSTGKSVINATILWAGDSRCYVLDSSGLKQLTEDDIDGLDPMENLSADGVMTNVISTSKDFELHHREMCFSMPCLLLSATDGCFGYYSTPMEFENLLLSTLISSKSVSEWERSITSELNTISGDDFTISGMALGFGNFESLRDYFFERLKKIQKDFISKLNDTSQYEKNQLWNIYKQEYCALMPRDEL